MDKCCDRTFSRGRMQAGGRRRGEGAETRGGRGERWRSGVVDRREEELVADGLQQEGNMYSNG